MFQNVTQRTVRKYGNQKVGAGVDEKGIGARRERHRLVPLLRLPYLNAK